MNSITKFIIQVHFKNNHEVYLEIFRISRSFVRSDKLLIKLKINSYLGYFPSVFTHLSINKCLILSNDFYFQIQIY